MAGYIKNMQENSKVVEAQTLFIQHCHVPKNLFKDKVDIETTTWTPLYCIAMLPCLSTRRENPGFLKTGGKTKRRGLDSNKIWNLVKKNSAYRLKKFRLGQCTLLFGEELFMCTLTKLSKIKYWSFLTIKLTFGFILYKADFSGQTIQSILKNTLSRR